MQNNHDIDDPFEIDEESPESAAESAVAGHREFAVGEDDRGQRLDRFIAVQLPEISRTHVQNLIDEGRVFVGGIAKKPSHRLETGETVNIEIPAPVLPGVAAEQIEVTLEPHAVTVSARRPLAIRNGDSVIRRLEIPHGHFMRRVVLPGRMQVAETRYVNGLLEVRLTWATANRVRE